MLSPDIRLLTSHGKYVFIKGRSAQGPSNFLYDSVGAYGRQSRGPGGSEKLKCHRRNHVHVGRLGLGVNNVYVFKFHHPALSSSGY